MILTIDQDHIAFLDAFLSQDSSQSLDFLQQLIIRNSLVAATDGRVPDDGSRSTIAR